MSILVKNSLLVTLVICLWNVSHCFAQERMAKLLTKEGQLISEGSNTTPVGELKATTYRLEIVKPALRSEVEGENPSENKIFRLTIKTQDELPLETFSIWIDGIESYGAIQVGSKSVVLLRHARTLESGLSLGLSVRGKKDLASRSVLPEKLYVPPEHATPLSEIEASRPVIKLRRLPRVIQINIDNIGTLDNLNCCGMGVEIEGYDSGARTILFICGGGRCTAGIPHEIFAHIPNGAAIIMKVRTANVMRTTVIGRLDKSRIE